MPYEDALIVTCPCCGHTFAPPLLARVPELSSVAYAVLTARAVSRTEQDALRAWRNGKPISTRQLAHMAGYSARHTRRGLSELARVGYVVEVEHACGKQFAGVPTLMARVTSLAA